MDLFPNETFPVMWGLFLLVLFSLHWLVFKPTLEIIEKRRHQGHGLEEKSKFLQQESLEKTAFYESEINAARQAAGQARESILKLAREEERRIIEEARQVAEASLKQLRATIEKEKLEASIKLKNEIESLSTEMVNRILA